MVIKSVERYAAAQGLRRITPEVMQTVREQAEGRVTGGDFPSVSFFVGDRRRASPEGYRFSLSLREGTDEVAEFIIPAPGKEESKGSLIEVPR